MTPPATTDTAIWNDTGIIGGTGFVGGLLARALPGSRGFSRANIADLAGARFGTLVCAGAPATMWAANADPDGDRRNLQSLAAAIATARFDRLILVSTIAVFADPAAGCTESQGVFETQKAYGTNRRALEEHAIASFGAVVVRLPALFGPGLRKNFIFDLLNPIPSFVKPAAHAALLDGADPAIAALIAHVFAFDAGLGSWRLDREALAASGDAPALTAHVAARGHLARNFTNSDSLFQFYNLANLVADLERCVELGLPVLNICSEPWRAGDIHAALTGGPFENSVPPPVREDMRSDHARAWHATGPWLYDRAAVARDLIAFHASAAGQDPVGAR